MSLGYRWDVVAIGKPTRERGLVKLCLTHASGYLNSVNQMGIGLKDLAI